MGVMKHAADSATNDKKPERVILSGLFFLETVLMTTRALWDQTWNPVILISISPFDLYPLPRKPRIISSAPSQKS
jgi:hypothetical protein